jgi:hypothetical protein
LEYQPFELLNRAKAAIAFTGQQ